MNLPGCFGNRKALSIICRPRCLNFPKMKVSRPLEPALRAMRYLQAFVAVLPDTFPVLFVTVVSRFVTCGPSASLHAREWSGNCIPQGRAAYEMRLRTFIRRSK